MSDVEIRTIPPRWTKLQANALLDHGLKHRTAFHVRYNSTTLEYEALSGLNRTITFHDPDFYVVYNSIIASGAKSIELDDNIVYNTSGTIIIPQLVKVDGGANTIIYSTTASPIVKLHGSGAPNKFQLNDVTIIGSGDDALQVGLKLGETGGVNTASAYNIGITDVGIGVYSKSNIGGIMAIYHMHIGNVLTAHMQLNGINQLELFAPHFYNASYTDGNTVFLFAPLVDPVRGINDPIKTVGSINVHGGHTWMNKDIIRWTHNHGGAKINFFGTQFEYCENFANFQAVQTTQVNVDLHGCIWYCNGALKRMITGTIAGTSGVINFYSPSFIGNVDASFVFNDLPYYAVDYRVIGMPLVANNFPAASSITESQSFGQIKVMDGDIIDTNFIATFKNIQVTNCTPIYNGEKVVVDVDNSYIDSAHQKFKVSVKTLGMMPITDREIKITWYAKKAVGMAYDSAVNGVADPLFTPITTPEVNPLVIIDDNIHAFFTSRAYVTDSDDAENKMSGANSLKIVSSDETSWLSADGLTLDLSTKDCIRFFVFGAGTRVTTSIIFQTSPDNYLRYVFGDAYVAWRLFRIPYTDFTIVGSPSWANITHVGLSGIGVGTIRFDRLVADVSL